MDMRQPKWFSRIRIGDLATQTDQPMSLTKLMAGFSALLAETNGHLSRVNNGPMISLELSPMPFVESTNESYLMNQVVAGIDPALVENDPSRPIEGELLEDYLVRLDSLDFPAATAVVLAESYYGHAPMLDEMLGIYRNWLADHQIKRLIKLNSSAEAFESASPDEYHRLKTYALERYPRFAANLKFRTAT